MPRRGNNRVGIEVVADVVSAEKGEDEPHADSVVDEASSTMRMKSSASAAPLEVAKAHRQKELLRMKKAERRAHAKQRTAEKQQWLDEKKQKRELEQMLDEDVPALEPAKLITRVDTAPSTAFADEYGGKMLDSINQVVTEDVAQEMEEEGAFRTSNSARSMRENLRTSIELERTQLDAGYPPPEVVPKNVKKISQPAKSTNDAAHTIQKALKKKFKKCKTLFRQSPRIFSEEVVISSAAEEIDPSSVCNGEVSAPGSPGAMIDTLIETTEHGPLVESIEDASPLSGHATRPEPIVPPLQLPQAKSSTSPPRSARSVSSSSRSCSSSCSCSDSGTCSSCSLYSCSPSNSCSSLSTSSESGRNRSSRRRRRSSQRSRTARSLQGDRRRSRHHTARSSRSHTHSSSGPSSSLLSVLQPEGEKKYGELHHFMATRIQALVRGHRGRAKSHQRQVELDQKIREEALHELQQEAVVKIQTRARGVMVRKKMPISDNERRRRRRRRSQLDDNLSLSPPGSPHECYDVEPGVYEDPDEIGEWPQEVDLELLDDWQELNQPPTTLGDTVTQAQFLSKGRLRVFCGTWNMHAKKPIDDLRLWIRLNKYHIVAVGSEECVNSIAKSVVFTSKKSWEDQLRNTLGEDYVLVTSHALTAIHNIVFVHTSVLPLLGNIQSDAVATGLGNQLGNKGGVGVAFTIGTTSFAFINCHFDAHQRNVSKRNGNFHRINHELKLSPTVTAPSSPTNAVAPTPGSPNSSLQGLGRTSANRFSMLSGVSAGSKRTVSELFDRVFWYGDLNYRINGTRRMVDTLLLRNQHEVLYANDQLQREMKAGHVFAHFREGQLNFRPTYKFDKRSDVYDSSSKQRIPSWTDRVLYLSNHKVHDIELLSYRSQTNFRTSDHRPVCAVFQVNFSAAGIAESLQSPRSGDGHNNGLPHENHVSSQACTIQ